jgi:hypothetical protein
MLSQDQRHRIAASIRTPRIVVTAMAMGVLAFLVVVLMLPPRADRGEPLVAYIAVAFAVVALAASMALSKMVAKKSVQRILAERASVADDRFQGGVNDQTLDKLLGVFSTKLIIYCALLEGGAFFNLVAYLIDGQVINLYAVGALLVMMAIGFPTLGGAEDWITQALRTGQ